MYRWHRRLLLGRWSILTFCRVTHACSSPGEAIVGGLMYFLFETSKITAARDAKLVSENAANRRIEQKPSAIKAIGRS
jgi:hypothetical protein